MITLLYQSELFLSSLRYNAPDRLRELICTAFLTVDESAKLSRGRRDQIIRLVDEIQTLQSRLPSTKSDLAKAALERQITATDRQIDELVYDLYELTPAEIKIVEEATA